MTSKDLARWIFRRSPGFGFDDLTDGALARTIRRYELFLAGEPVSAAGTEKQTRRWLVRASEERDRRAALRDFWNADEAGVDKPADYWQPHDGRGPRTPVEGARPNYWLALLLDLESFHRYGRSALAWGSTS